MPPYGGRLSGGAVCPSRRGVASSEAEMSYPLEGGSLPSSEAEMVCMLAGRFATLERGGDAGHSRGSRGEPSSEAEIVPRAGPRGVRMGRMLGFFESFTFFQIGRRPWAFAGPVALTCICVLKRSEYSD